jgi:hypothetical protein
MADYDSLPAGRGMDTRVAAEIFGGRAGRPHWYWSRRSSLDTEADLYGGPRFSTSIAAAWELIDRLTSPVAPTSTYRKVHLDLDFSKARCVIDTPEGLRVEAGAQTVPLAICRAALKAAAATATEQTGATAPVAQGSAEEPQDAAEETPEPLPISRR